MANYLFERNQVITLLNAVSATGAGDGWESQEENRSDHTVEVTFDATVTAVTVDLEGSFDGVNWYQLAQHVASGQEITDQKLMFHVQNKVVRFVRGNITAYTGSGNVTVKYLSD